MAVWAFAGRSLGTGIPGFRLHGKERRKMEDNIDKYTTHDFARIFADDIKEYLERGGSTEGLSATNVYNVLDGEHAEDIFSYTTNIVTAVNELVTESARSYFLKCHIRLQETSFAFGKDSLLEIRKQIAGDKRFGDWTFNEYVRYFALLSNLNIMSYRNVFKEMGDKPQMFKDIYMMVDMFKEGNRDGKDK